MSKDIDVVSKAKKVTDDFTSHPAYYMQIITMLGAVAIGYKILEAVVEAVDNVPVLPAVMEVVS